MTVTVCDHCAKTQDIQHCVLTGRDGKALEIIDLCGQCLKELRVIIAKFHLIRSLTFI